MGVGARCRFAPVKPRLVFVDGRDRIDAGCECQAVIGGDGLVASVAAASIVAKVTRDRLMACLGAAHPGYGFERHMGYSVPEHFAALDRLGPTVHHRRSFSPVAGALGQLGADADDIVAAAVILDPDNVPRGLDDSKRLTPERREVLYERICARAQVAVAMAPPARIDRDNILRASLWALARAVASLP